MKKSLALFAITIFLSAQVMAGVQQSADLHLSLNVNNRNLEVIQMYTYLDTRAEVFEGHNVFEAITFRGDGLKLKLNEDQSQLVADLNGKQIVLTHVELTQAQNGDDGFKSVIVKDAAKIQLVHASLGKKIKFKQTSCLPGSTFCTTRTIRVKPHQYIYEVTGSDGEVLCIKRGFNTTPENYGKNPDKYSLGNCN